MEAKRFDEGKLRYSLLPQDGIDALARHYGVGAAKYGDFNWEKGMAHSRVLDSLLRHVAAYRRGEDVDADTGSLHLIAAAWNALTLAVYQMRGVGADDRNTAEPSETEYAVADTVLTVLNREGAPTGAGVLVCADKAGAWLRVPHFAGTGETVIYREWEKLRGKGAPNAAGA